MNKEEKRERILELVNEINEIKEDKVIDAESGRGYGINDDEIHHASLEQLENELKERKKVLSEENLKIQKLHQQIEDLL